MSIISSPGSKQSREFSCHGDTKHPNNTVYILESVEVQGKRAVADPKASMGLIVKKSNVLANKPCLLQDIRCKYFEIQILSGWCN